MKGQCLCGAVHYQLNGTIRPVIACHCNQCRKTSGHYVAATQVKTAELEIEGSDAIRWYQSSDDARRGFCGTCGSQLFWQPRDKDVTSVMAGTIDGKTGLTIEKQIFCEDKGDYYSLPILSAENT